jgi:hypothetical protein
MEGCEINTVWTWNAIGKQSGAWGLAADAPEAKKGFLMNHLITELLPEKSGVKLTNSDPITGQAAWYDLRVNIRPATEQESGESAPQFSAIHSKGVSPSQPRNSEEPLNYQSHKAVNMNRSLADILGRK